MRPAAREPFVRVAKRFRWLKRLAAAAAVGLLLMAGAWLAAQRWAAARIARSVAEFRSLPVARPEGDGDPPGVLRDPRNPAAGLTAALAGMPYLTDSQADWESGLDGRPPDLLGPQDVAVVEAMRARFAAEFAALRAARVGDVDDRPRWAVGPVGIAMLLPLLNPSRELANRVSYVMSLERREGDIGGLAEHGSDLRRLSTLVGGYGPCLVSSQVAIGIDGLNTRRLIGVASYRPDGVSADDDDAAWRRARQPLTTLIAQLLDGSHTRQLLSNGLGGEWALSLDFRNFDGQNFANAGPRNFLTATLFDAAVAEALEAEAAMWHAAQSGAVDADLVRRFAQAPRPRRLRSLAGEVLDDLRQQTVADPAVAGHFVRARVVDAAAATALAARLYRADHGGALPATLGDLVPDYLPAVPLDPLDPAGRPLRYATLGGVPFLYSVGEDGTDDGGDPSPLPTPMPYRYRAADWHRRDVLFPLGRFAAVAAMDPVYMLEGVRVAATRPAASPAGEHQP